MGRKYASIHVKGNELENILLLLENNCSNDLEEEIWKMVREKYKDDIPESIQRLLKDKYSNRIIIIKSDELISIYDETNSFESIQDKVKYLSSKLDYPILYTSNFDDGIFLIGTYKSGKLITSGKMGPELSEYGMRPKQIDINKLCKAFELDRTDELATVNSLVEIDEIEDVIEKWLHIPLDLDIDLLETNATYVETYSNERVRVYNKL